MKDKYRHSTKQFGLTLVHRVDAADQHWVNDKPANPIEMFLVRVYAGNRLIQFTHLWATFIASVVLLLCLMALSRKPAEIEWLAEYVDINLSSISTLAAVSVLGTLITMYIASKLSGLAWRYGCMRSGTFGMCEAACKYDSSHYTDIYWRSHNALLLIYDGLGESNPHVDYYRFHVKRRNRGKVNQIFNDSIKRGALEAAYRSSL